MVLDPLSGFFLFFSCWIKWGREVLLTFFWWCFVCVFLVFVMLHEVVGGFDIFLAVRSGN